MTPKKTIIFALSCCAVTAAGAQTEKRDPARIEDRIVVTSTKREVALEDSSDAVSVVDGEVLREFNVTRLDDVSGRLPGLTISKNDGAGRVVSMRGVGWETAQNLSTQPGVLLYVDGVYVVNPLAFGLDLDSVERVEVFRGPQGTEFGQSATGGAIHLVTEQPAFDRMSVDASLALGSYDRLEANAALNLPFNDRFALRLSGRSLDRDGFAEIRGGSLDGYDLDDADSISGRLVAQWLPAPHWSIRLSAMAYDSDQHGAAQKHIDDPLPDPRQLTQDFPSTFGLDSERTSALVNWTAGGSTVIQSLTAWQHLTKSQTVDGDRLTEDLVAVDLTGSGAANFDLLPVWDNGSEAFSQELAALGGGGRVDWVAGIYFLEHRNHNFFVELTGPAPASQFAEQIADPNPHNLPPFRTPLEFVENRTVTRSDGAAYAQASIRLQPRLELTVGGRWQHDRSRDRTTQFWVLDSEQRVADDEATWRLGINRGIGDRHLLFASLATGWRNGGLNPGALVGGALDVPSVFQPEKVTTLEVGSRSSLAGGRSHASFTGFYNRYRNYQFIQEDPIPFAAGTGNIPRVTIYGLESEVTRQLGRQLELSGQVTLLDGSINSAVSALDVVDFLRSGVGRFTEEAVEKRAELRENLAGNVPPKLAEVSARLALTHRRRSAGGWRWTSRAEIVHRGEFQYRVFNDLRVDTVPAYTTVSWVAGMEPPAGRWNFGVTVSNLFDRDGVNSRFTNPFGLHTTSDELIPPREIVGRIAIRY